MSINPSDPYPERHENWGSDIQNFGEVTEEIADELAKRAVSKAVGMTFRAALADRNNPEIRPYMIYGAPYSTIRPERPNDMQAGDLKPGVRVWFFNDKLHDKWKFVKHEAVLSEPYMATDENGEEFLAVDARRVADHATDTIPLDSDEGKRTVALSRWGLVPTEEGYHTTWYIEPYAPSDPRMY
ncbi:MAG TPA: hypothetical protein VK978_02895 [Candidatus Saccharimonadales bacterium]|nr:hypothetical protein [Candidatus Saccharimonadales bacterium]